jgi:metal-responsive CopG/Arc/MetJ family transcriptional regulator
MAVLIPRMRTLGVRLSEDEYSSLEKFCLENGARSMSDLARTAIFSFVNRANQENVLTSAVSAHFAQVKDLEQRLKQLTAEIALLQTQEDPAGVSQDHRVTPEEEAPPEQ